MTFIRSLRRTFGRDRDTQASAANAPLTTAVPSLTGDLPGTPVEIAPTDPLFAYLQSAVGVVDIDRLDLDSPAVRELRDAGVRVVVPLVTQGELIGALYLGPRLSDQFDLKQVGVGVQFGAPIGEQLESRGDSPAGKALPGDYW